MLFSRDDAAERGEILPCREAFGKLFNQASATKSFRKSFVDQDFGYPCSVCDRLWYQNDLRPSLEIHAEALGRIEISGPNIMLCSCCRKSLAEGKIPARATYNGFQYPPKPPNLPKLNAITTRLISPRIPFMQIRRLRRDFGTYRILGQIINVPVDVETMVRSLSRDLADDFAFNVSLKKHLIHKTTAYEGEVKKNEINPWLEWHPWHERAAKIALGVYGKRRRSIEWISGSV